MSSLPVTPERDITLRSSGLPRRRRTEKFVGLLALLSALVAVGILALVLGTVLFKGFSQLSLGFFTKPAALFGQQGGIGRGPLAVDGHETKPGGLREEPSPFRHLDAAGPAGQSPEMDDQGMADVGRPDARPTPRQPRPRQGPREFLTRRRGGPAVRGVLPDPAWIPSTSCFVA